MTVLNSLCREMVNLREGVHVCRNRRQNIFILMSPVLLHVVFVL